jgi:hypothetical protein
MNVPLLLAALVLFGLGLQIVMYRRLTADKRQAAQERADLHDDLDRVLDRGRSVPLHERRALHRAIDAFLDTSRGERRTRPDHGAESGNVIAMSALSHDCGGDGGSC